MFEDTLRKILEKCQKIVNHEWKGSYADFCEDPDDYDSERAEFRGRQYLAQEILNIALQK